MVKIFKLLILLIISVAIVVSCNLSGGDDDDNNPTSPITGGLKFNLQGAKAIAASGGTSSLARIHTKSTNPQLLKILEDGTVANIFDFSQNYFPYIPDISFLYIGEDKSLYVCFSGSFSFPNTEGIFIQAQFIRLKPDNTYEILWPLDPSSSNYGSQGCVRTYTWYGMDMDPILVGSDGKLYFMVEKSSAGYNTSHVYMYDPHSGGKPVLRTPANSTAQLESFTVDSQNRLFVKSSYSPNSPNFLRFYSPGNVSPVNIYYDSTSNLWVRSYTTDPEGTCLIIVGNNIRNMNGIIRASISGDTVNYELHFLLSTVIHTNSNGKQRY